MVKPEYGTIAAFFPVKRLEQRSEYEVRGPVSGRAMEDEPAKNVVKGERTGPPRFCVRALS